MNTGRTYWMAALLLLVLHTTVVFAAYQFSVRRTRLTPEGTTVSATAGEVQAALKEPVGQVSYGLALPVVLYALLGYVALAIALGIGLASLLRGQPGVAT